MEPPRPFPLPPRYVGPGGAGGSSTTTTSTTASSSSLPGGTGGSSTTAAFVPLPVPGGRYPERFPGMKAFGGPGCSTRPRLVAESSSRVAHGRRRRLDVEQLLFESDLPALACAAVALGLALLHALP